jgi:hypothetical protein
LQFASHRIVPVDKRSLGVVAQARTCNSKKSANLKRFGAGTDWKSWTSSAGGVLLLFFLPPGCIHDVPDAHQPALVPHRLVDQGFSVCDIDLAVARQIAIDVIL